MSSNNSEVVVERILLQRALEDHKEYPFMKYPVSIEYKNHQHTANVYANSGMDRHIYLHLGVTSSPLMISFKLEIEDRNKNMVFSFLGHWQIKVMTYMVNVSLLNSQTPSLLINGTDLNLVVSLGPWEELIKPKIETVFKTKVETKFIPDETPMESLKAMLDKGIFADVVIKTEGKEFPCHKVVLAASSEVFRAMFETDMKENQQNVVDLTEVYDAPTIRDVLHYLYTKQTPPDIEKTASTLLVAADYFQLAALKDLCVVILCKVIAVDTAARGGLRAGRPGRPPGAPNSEGRLIGVKFIINFIFENIDIPR